MNKFKYNFSKLFYIIAGVGSLVAVACIILNAIRYSSNIQKGIELNLYNHLSLIFTIILALAFIVVVITAALSSKYTVYQDKVVLNWGIIKNTIKLSEVKSIKLVTDTQKLEFIFDDESYFVIVIKKEEYEKFVDSVKAVNNKITYVQGVDIE
ncbi:MAG: hypothetical protein J6V66_00855 [Clostridia bacterium]|nr:hypothetical protein [Clostridia bacterium]